MGYTSDLGPPDPVDITVAESGDMVVEHCHYSLGGTMPDGAAFDDEDEGDAR